MSNATSPTDSQGSTIITTSSPSVTTSNQHYQAGLAGRNYQSRNSLSSTPASSTEFNAGNSSKYRASVDAGGYGTASTAGLLSGGLHSSSNGSRNWPNSRAGAGNSANNNGTARPASELSGGNNLNNLGMNQFVSPESKSHHTRSPLLRSALSCPPPFHCGQHSSCPSSRSLARI